MILGTIKHYKYVHRKFKKGQVIKLFCHKPLISSCPGMAFLSQLYPSSQNEGTLRGEMNRQQAKNAFPGQELINPHSLASYKKFSLPSIALNEKIVT